MSQRRPHRENEQSCSRDYIIYHAQPMRVRHETNERLTWLHDYASYSHS